MSFDLSKFRNEFLQSDGWKVSDCYKPYEDKFLRKDAQDAYEGAKWGFEAGASSRQAEIDGLQKKIDEAIYDLQHIEYAMWEEQVEHVLMVLKGKDND